MGFDAARGTFTLPFKSFGVGKTLPLP